MLGHQLSQFTESHGLSCDTVDEDQTGFCLGVNVGIHLKSWNNQPITFTIFLLALPFFWGVCGSAYNPIR